MKTVQKGNDIKRVKDEDADLMVSHRGYKFVPKSVWKEATRPVKQTKEKEVKEDVKEND
mgnify:CR=1 FL=1|jgi:hypothetical protein